MKRSRETLMVQLRLEPELAVVSVCCMHVFSSTISRASIDVENEESEIRQRLELIEQVRRRGTGQEGV